MIIKLLMCAAALFVLTIIVGILGFIGIRKDNKKLETVAWVFATIIMLGVLVLFVLACEYGLVV